MTKTITLDPISKHEETYLDATVLPGMNIVPIGGTDLHTPGQGIPAVSPPRIVKENALRGKTVDDVFAIGDLVSFVYPEIGERIRILLKAGETIEISSPIGPDTDGKYILVDPTLRHFESLEAFGPAGVDTLVSALTVNLFSGPLFPSLGMILNVDPDDIADLSQDSAGTVPVEFNYDPIGHQRDRTINMNNAIQTTTSKKPTYRTNQQNGKAAVHYDGVDDLLDLVDPPANPLDNPQFELDDFSIYVVGRRHATGADHTFISLQGTDVATRSSGIFFVIISENLFIFMANSGSTFASVKTSGVSFPAGEFFLIEAIKTGTSVEIYKNGVLVPQITTGVIPASIRYDPSFPLKSYLGASSLSTGDGRFHFGDLGQTLVYDRGHGAGDRTTVENIIIPEWVLPTGAMQLGTGDSEKIITGDGAGITIL